MLLSQSPNPNPNPKYPNFSMHHLHRQIHSVISVRPKRQQQPLHRKRTARRLETMVTVTTGSYSGRLFKKPDVRLQMHFSLYRHITIWLTINTNTVKPREAFLILFLIKVPDANA